MISLDFEFWNSSSKSSAQENGHDSELKTLRQVLQQLEASGMVDLEIGGHTFSRPAAVVQGLAADKFFGSDYEPF